MEKNLSENEKIRRAEEIYFKRNCNNSNSNMKKINLKQNRKSYFGSKIILEMLILLLTACGVFAVKNKNFIFSEEFLEKMSCYNFDVTEKIKDFFNDNNDQKNNSINNNETISNLTETISVIQENAEDKTTLIKPIAGIVTSRFGSRNSSYSNVTKEHTGIDIASDVGTQIVSVSSGIVKQVSTEGDYGNHVKISNDEMDTLYAHCDEIYVVEGQEIVKGDVIATVGNTGNSTGPHLHFEIRIENEPVDPSNFIQF